MSRRFRRGMALVAWSVAVVACGKLAGLDDLEIDDCYGGRCDASTRAEGGNLVEDAGIESASGDDAERIGDENPVGDTGTDVLALPCPGSGGPPGVRIGGSAGPYGCIDRTEVTAAQYEVFLAAKGADTSGQDARCAWNTSYAPTIAGAGDLPVRGVDFCDAAAFCKWAGKRLCGKVPNGAVAGGPLDVSNHANVVQNQWLAACTNNATNAFPYGNTYVKEACNDYSGGNAPRAVATTPTCKTTAGAFDMVGNVYEWFDYASEKAGDGSADACFIMGGGFGSGAPAGYPPETYSCTIEFTVSRNFTASDVGFRCCSP